MLNFTRKKRNQEKCNISLMYGTSVGFIYLEQEDTQVRKIGYVSVHGSSFVSYCISISVNESVFDLPNIMQ